MFQKTILKNGLRLVTVPIKGTEVVTLLILVKAGSRYEDKKVAGISHFAEHLLFKGTKKRPNSIAIASEIDSIGGIMNAFTSKEFTGYFVKISQKHLEKAFDVLSDVLQNPLLRADDIEKEKQVIIQEINMYEDTPLQKIGDLLEQTLYGSHPLGRDVIGTKETIMDIEQADLKNYLNKFYKADNIVIVVAGALKEEKIQNFAKKYFHFKVLESAVDFQKVAENQTEPQLKIKKQKTEQAHICLGVRAYDSDNPQKFIVEVMSVLLGGGMSSRLFAEIREKHSLAYYVKAENQCFKDCGFMYVQAGVDPKNIRKTIQIILKEMVKLKSEKVSEKELQKAKEFFKGKLTLEIEGSCNLAELIGLQELLDKKTRTPREIFEEIGKVSASDIQRVAQEIFVNGKLNLAVIAPNAKEKELKKILKF